MLALALLPFARLALHMFFCRITLIGHQAVPRGRPLLFIANHPNLLLDALLVAAFAPGSIPRFIGKSTLFRRRLASFFLRLLGVIAAARPQDGRQRRVATNTAMLQEAGDQLRRGGALALFPEGRCHAQPRLLPFKSGAARLALRLEDETDGASGLCIVPLGLNYSRRARRVTLRFGPVLSAKPYLQTYRSRRADGIQALSALMHRRLLGVCTYGDEGTPPPHTRRFWKATGTPLAALGWLAALPVGATLRFMGPVPAECRASYRFAVGGLALGATAVSAAGLLAFFCPPLLAAAAVPFLVGAQCLNRRRANS